MEGKGRSAREKRLYEASLAGDVSSLNQLIKEDELTLARVCITCFNETPLHIAAMLGHLEFVKALLHHNEDLAAELDSQGLSPLHLASANGYVEIVKELISVNSDVCLIHDEDGRTPLHIAVMKGRVGVIQELIHAKPEVVRYRINMGETLLHLALKYNRFGSLKLLVELVRNLDRRNSFVDIKDDGGNTILHTATSLKQIETVKYLLSVTGVNINFVNANGFTALDIIENMPRDLKVMEIRECLTDAGALTARKLAESARSKHQNSELSEIFQVAPNSESVAQALVASSPGEGKVLPQNSQSSGKKKKKKKQNDKWVDKKRDALMVAASVIATMTYQAALSPPGGVWDHDSNKDDPESFSAGTSVMATTAPTAYSSFWIRNTISFIASLSTMFLLVSGLPLKRRIFMYILMAAMWVTITSMALSYLGVVLALSKSQPSTAVFPAIVISLLIWLGLIVIVLLIHGIRFIIRIIVKVRKIRRKSLAGSDEA